MASSLSKKKRTPRRPLKKWTEPNSTAEKSESTTVTQKQDQLEIGLREVTAQKDRTHENVGGAQHRGPEIDEVRVLEGGGDQGLEVGEGTKMKWYKSKVIEKVN